MATTKPSLKRGTTARKARNKTAMDLQQQGDSPDKAFAIATSIVQGASAAGRKRLAKRGLKKAKKTKKATT